MYYRSCSSSSLGLRPLKPATRVRFPHTTPERFCPCSSADQSTRLRTGVSEVQFLPGVPMTEINMGRAELALGWVSKTSRQGSIPWRPAHVVLAPRMANAGRQLKISG